MAFPTVNATQSAATGTNTTSHSVTLPTHAVGELLMAVVTFRDDSASSPGGYLDTITAGWQYEQDRKLALNADGFVTVMWKVAESTSETLSFTTTETGDGCAVVHSINGANRISSVGAAGSTLGANLNAPASPDLGTARDYLFFTTFQNLSNVTPSAAPAGYTNLTTTDNGSAEVAVAQKTANATSDDPGTWTNSATIAGEGYAFTFAVWQGENNFPTVNGVSTTTVTTPTNIHTITLPSHSIGDLLVVFGSDINSLQIHIGEPGWQRAYESDFVVIWKVAESASETLTWQGYTGFDFDAGWIAYSVSGANDLELQTWSGDPGTVNLTDTKDYLWLVAQSNWAGGATAATAPPENYSNLQSVSLSSTNHISTARREFGGPSQVNIGTFEFTTSGNQRSIAVALFDRGEATIRRKFRFVSYPQGSNNPFAGVDRLATTDGWDATETNAASNFQYSTSEGPDGSNGKLDLTFDRDGLEDGYAEWTGTLEELGVPSGATVTGVSDAELSWKITENLNATPNSWYLGDAQSSEGALVFDDGTTAHTVINQINHGFDQTSTFTTAGIDNTVSGLSLASTASVSIRINTHYDGNIFTSSGSARTEIDDVAIIFDVQTGETISVDTKALSLTTQAPNVDESIIPAVKTFSLTEQDTTVNAENNIAIGLFTFALITYEAEVGKVNVDTYAFTGITTNDVDFTVTVDVDATSFALSTNDALLEETIPVDLQTFTLNNTLDHEIVAGEFIVIGLYTFTLNANTPFVNDVIGVDTATLTLTSNDHIPFVNPYTLYVQLEQTKFDENTGGGAINNTVTSALTTIILRGQYAWTVPDPVTVEWIAD